MKPVSTLAILLFLGGCALILSPWEEVLTFGLLCSGLGLGVFFDSQFCLLDA